MATATLSDWQIPRGGAQLQDMRRRLRATRYPASTCAGWSRGTDVEYLRDFAAYLSDDYDWDTDCQRFGGEHFMVRPDGPDSPAIHVSFPLGRMAGCQPLVLLHGWPSSGFEFVHVIAHLTKSGGNPQLCPVLVDLPGFGFSDPTPAPAGPRAIADLVTRALSDGLGLRDMIVHGNDWGSTVASWMAIDAPSLLQSIHMSMMGMKPGFSGGAPKPSDTEMAWIKVVQKRLAADAGYREIQGTRPNTAAIGLSDSPAALAGWIIEKFHGWSGANDTAPPPVARDDLAAIVTSYWLSGNIGSANWIYSAVHAHDDTGAPVGGTGDVPVGFSFFGNGFFPAPPESWARRIHNVTAYRLHDTGGHYPALIQPADLAADLLDFASATGQAPI